MPLRKIEPRRPKDEWQNLVFHKHVKRTLAIVLRDYSLQIGNLTSCHQNFSRMACNLLYPECPHYGPTLRPCRSDCQAVTAACSSLYEAVTGMSWPIDCSDFTDSATSTDGFCLAANGGTIVFLFVTNGKPYGNQ